MDGEARRPVVTQRVSWTGPFLQQEADSAKQSHKQVTNQGTIRAGLSQRQVVEIIDLTRSSPNRSAPSSPQSDTSSESIGTIFRNIIAERTTIEVKRTRQADEQNAPASRSHEDEQDWSDWMYEQYESPPRRTPSPAHRHSPVGPGPISPLTDPPSRPRTPPWQAEAEKAKAAQRLAGMLRAVLDKQEHQVDAQGTNAGGQSLPVRRSARPPKPNRKYAQDTNAGGQSLPVPRSAKSRKPNRLS